jgi:hypothetical protein
MGYIDLGPSLAIPAAIDTTGLNLGFLTMQAGPSQLLVKVGQFEIWHMVLTNVPAGASARIFYNAQRPFGFCFPQLGGSEWWGRLPMRQSDTLYFLWNLASSTAPASYPTLTCYMQYDNTLPGNT